VSGFFLSLVVSGPLGWSPSSFLALPLTSTDSARMVSLPLVRPSQSLALDMKVAVVELCVIKTRSSVTSPRSHHQLIFFFDLSETEENKGYPFKTAVAAAQRVRLRGLSPRPIAAGVD
jgi:hypothetical protein